MNQDVTLIHQRLKTPRAAAIAGFVFATLFILSHLLIRNSIPPNPFGSAIQIVNHAKTISRVLTVVPFAGIAFLWFIGAVRDHFGELEDRFFATVFLGSGLLYIALTFFSAAIAGGLLVVLGHGTGNVVQSGAYAFGRATISKILNIHAIRMAAVFMISTSTIFVCARLGSRWLAFLGYALALVLWLSLGTSEWAPMVFPCGFS